MIRFLRWLLVLVMLAAFAAGGLAVYVKDKFEAEGPLQEDKPFTVARGMSVSDVAFELSERGMLRDGWVFTIAAWATGDYRRIRAGEYLAPKGASMATLLDIIVEGREYLRRVTIPEGWTSEMAVARLLESADLAGEVAEIPAEGSLLPDTYAFRKGEERIRVIKEMQLAQQKLLDELWPGRAADLPFTTREEAITLASIVEKETSVAAERPRVAAVFINRLRKGMRLQSDPTVIYGLVGGKGRLERDLTRADLRETTPYNTYRMNGLPPGPIANPGRDSIAAVLNPLVTRDLYFVADGSGGHAFAETLGDHNVNVKEWRELQRRLAEEAEADAQVPLPRPRPLRQ